MTTSSLAPQRWVIVPMSHKLKKNVIQQLICKRQLTDGLIQLQQHGS